MPSYHRQFLAIGWFQIGLKKLTCGRGARRERLRSVCHLSQTIVVYEKVQRLRSIAEPTSYSIEPLVSSMLDGIFNLKANAA